MEDAFGDELFGLAIKGNAMTIRAGPLNGIRVVDFGHYIAGPLCGMLLADQGADVIKVDRPSKSSTRTPEDAVFNRNKRRIELDLKKESDLKRARKLAMSADVVIENFRPGVMERLGLDASSLCNFNPRMIYLSLPGFSSTDTENASIRAFEGIIGAATGLYTDLQELRRLLGGRPIYTPVPLASTYGAIQGATAVALALYRREKINQGDQIEVPLAAAAMSAMAIINLRIDNKPPRYDAPALTVEERQRIPEWKNLVGKHGDDVLTTIAQSLINQNQPTTSNYQAADKRWIYFVGSGHGPNTRAILKALGIYDDLINAGMVDLPVFDNLHLDNNIADGPGWSRNWNGFVRKQIQQRVLQKSAYVWEQELISKGIPAAAHRSSREWLNAPETSAAGLVVDVHDSTFGMIRQIGVQVTLSNSSSELMEPIPCCEAQVEHLLSENEFFVEEVGQLTDKKQTLEGVRVLDLSNVLAGPVAGRTLAEYGAEVIKIDPPEPNFGPRISCMFPIEASPGKRSIILDINSLSGQEVFHKLVKTADVIVHNFRLGVSEKMGIDQKSLRSINPDLVHLNITAFNGPKPGPWMGRSGFDPVLQAATGIQTRYGGINNTPLYHGWASCIDYITGYSGTFGVALSLLRAKREQGKNGGDFVATSLAQGAQLVQVPFLIETKERQPGSEVQGQNAVGEHALYRFYKASNGWVFVAALRSEFNFLTSVAEFHDLDTRLLNEDGNLQQYLEKKVALKSVTHWINVFETCGIGAKRVDTLEDVRNQYLHEGSTTELKSNWDDGRTISWVRFTDHPVGAPVELAAPAYVRCKNAQIKLQNPTPKQGTHTREILKELGYNEQAINSLLNEGVINDQLHKQYLPD